MNKENRKYVNARGDFEFPKFLYHKHNSLMKLILDLGNLACSDQTQLRAFKERVKKDFKSTWNEYAQLFYEAGIVEPCSCDPDEYCQICGGSRFVPNEIFTSDEVIESVFVTSGNDPAVLQRLQEGLVRANIEVDRLNERD